MSTALLTPSPPPQPPQRRFTVQEYHRMIEADVLGEDDPVELLEGWIVLKMPRNPRHDAVIDRSADALRRALPPAWRVRVQSAITTSDSEPEPDIAIAAGPASRYDAMHPQPSDLALVIEVADSSLTADRDVKRRLYARAGIAVYWIINLSHQVVEVYTEPSGPSNQPAYRRNDQFRPGQSISLRLNDETMLSILVSDLLS